MSEMLNIYAEKIVINYMLSILLFCIVILYLQHVFVCTCACVYVHVTFLSPVWRIKKNMA